LLGLGVAILEALVFLVQVLLAAQLAALIFDFTTGKFIGCKIREFGKGFIFIFILDLLK
jgi:hypothetical protein